MVATGFFFIEHIDACTKNSGTPVRKPYTEEDQGTDTTTMKLATLTVDQGGEEESIDEGATFVDDCGLNKYNNIVQFGAGIVGGIDALINQYPWIVRVIARSGDQWYYICGGTIISENYVLTAAHCIDAGYDEYAVIVGDHSNLKTETSQQTIAISQTIKHPKHDSSSVSHDFGLMKLQSRCQLSFFPLKNDS